MTTVAELLFQLFERSFKSSFPAPCRAPAALQNEMNAHPAGRLVGVKSEIPALADLAGTNNNNYANLCPLQMSSDEGPLRQESMMENLVSNPQDSQFTPTLIFCPLLFLCSDKMFPAFGFGARIPPDFKVTSLALIEIRVRWDFFH